MFYNAQKMKHNVKNKNKVNYFTVRLKTMYLNRVKQLEIKKNGYKKNFRKTLNKVLFIFFSKLILPFKYKLIKLNSVKKN